MSTQSLEITAAAAAAGIPFRTLRAWTDRRVIHLDADEQRPPTGYSKRQFSTADTLRVAFVFELSRHGVPIATASRVLEEAINFDLMVSDRATPAEVAASFADQILVAWLDRRDGRWLWAIEPHVQVNAPTLIRIDLGAVARGVADRLAAA